jgi:hypothetical protein
VFRNEGRADDARTRQCRKTGLSGIQVGSEAVPAALAASIGCVPSGMALTVAS